MDHSLLQRLAPMNPTPSLPTVITLVGSNKAKLCCSQNNTKEQSINEAHILILTFYNYRYHAKDVSSSRVHCDNNDGVNFLLVFCVLCLFLDGEFPVSCTFFLFFFT